MMVEIDWPAGEGAGILVVDGLFDPEFIRRAYDELLTTIMSDGAPGRTTGGVMPWMKNSRDWGVPRGFWIEEQLHGALGAALAIYRQTFTVLDSIDALHDTGYQAQLSFPFDGYYRPHVDAEPLSQWWRILAPIVYLNDVAEGGETHFLKQDVMVAPKAGRMCLFPALWTHLHAGRIPLSDPKLILTTFVSAGNSPAEMMGMYANHLEALRKDITDGSEALPPPTSPPDAVS